MMVNQERIVAVGLLTDRDLAKLGQAFDRAYPLHGDADFTHLLDAIDRADRDYVRSQPSRPS